MGEEFQSMAGYFYCIFLAWEDLECEWFCFGFVFIFAMVKQPYSTVPGWPEAVAELSANTAVFLSHWSFACIVCCWGISFVVLYWESALGISLGHFNFNNVCSLCIQNEFKSWVFECASNDLARCKEWQESVGLKFLWHKYLHVQLHLMLFLSG